MDEECITYNIRVKTKIKILVTKTDETLNVVIFYIMFCKSKAFLLNVVWLK